MLNLTCWRCGSIMTFLNVAHMPGKVVAWCDVCDGPRLPNSAEYEDLLLTLDCGQESAEDVVGFDEETMEQALGLFDLFWPQPRPHGIPRRSLRRFGRGQRPN